MMIRFFIIATICLASLCGCGFHPRSLSFFSAAGSVYIDTENPDSHLVTQVNRLLQASDVVLTPSPSDAAIILRLKVSPINYEDPPIVDSTLAINLAYRLHVSIELLNQHNIPLLPEASLNVSSTLLKNANQVLLPRDAYRLMQRELMHSMVSLIYNYLASQQVQGALKNYAAHFQTVKHSSH